MNRDALWIWVIGNCQGAAIATSLSNTWPGKVCHSHCITPSSWQLSEQAIHESLAAFKESESLRLSCRPGLITQYPLLTAPSVPPEIIVVTMFHEARPMVRHRRSGWSLYVDTLPLKEHPELEEWIAADFEAYTPNPLTYGDRFCVMLHEIQHEYPEARVMVVHRLSARERCGVHPYSYLLDWDLIERDLDERLSRLETVEVIKMDDVLDELLDRRGVPLRELLPFFKYGIFGEQKPFPPGLENYQWPPSKDYFRIRMARDAEHAAEPLWDAVAARIESLCRGTLSEGAGPGSARIGRNEWIPPAISSDRLEKEPEKLSVWTDLFEHLLFRLPETDLDCLNRRTGSLLRIKNKYLLRMIGLYGDFAPSVPLLHFLEAHEEQILSQGDSSYERKLEEWIEKVRDGIEKTNAFREKHAKPKSRKKRWWNRLLRL